MKKTNKNTGSRNKKKEQLVWHTFEQVFGKYRKNKEFQRGYNEEMIRIRLANQIKKIRNTKKLTQKAVAQRARMPQSVIARMESGEHSVSLDTLNKIATALGKEVQLV